MIIYILIAILTGIVIGTCRTINGRLSIDIGPFKASFWNHIVGFIFLTFLLTLFGGWHINKNVADLPVALYFGGIFGALFVVINSYVFPRIGAIKSALLVISGQMIASIVLDYKNESIISTLSQFVGVAIILLGIYVAKLNSLKAEQQFKISEQADMKKVIKTLLDDPRHHIEFNGHLTNHNKHAVIALYRLGASQERIQAYYHAYAECTPYGMGLEPARGSKYTITQDNWEQYIGKRTSYLSYYDFFEEQEKKLGINALLKKYLPHLFPGWAGSLSHAIIHLGWALDINNQRMKIEGLAYMAFSYVSCHPERVKAVCKQAEEGSAFNSLLNVAAMWEVENSDLKKWALHLTSEDTHNEAWNIHPELIRSGLQYKIAKLLTEGHQQMYATPDWIFFQDVSVTWKQLHYTVTMLYLAEPGDFIILHLITALHAIEHIAELLTVQQTKEVIQCFWIGMLGILFARNNFPKHANLLLLDKKFKNLKDENTTIQYGQTWKKIIARAITEQEEHNPKMVYALKRMWEISGCYSVYRIAASKFTVTPVLPKSFEMPPIES